MYFIQYKNMRDALLGVGYNKHVMIDLETLESREVSRYEFSKYNLWGMVYRVYTLDAEKLKLNYEMDCFSISTSSNNLVIEKDDGMLQINGVSIVEWEKYNLAGLTSIEKFGNGYRFSIEDYNNVIGIETDFSLDIKAVYGKVSNQNSGYPIRSVEELFDDSIYYRIFYKSYKDFLKNVGGTYSLDASSMRFISREAQDACVMSKMRIGFVDNKKLKFECIKKVLDDYSYKLVLSNLSHKVGLLYESFTFYIGGHNVFYILDNGSDTFVDLEGILLFEEYYVVLLNVSYKDIVLFLDNKTLELTYFLIGDGIKVYSEYISMYNKSRLILGV